MLGIVDNQHRHHFRVFNGFMEGGWKHFSDGSGILPIDYRAIVEIVLGPVFAGFAHLVHDSVFIDGDSQTGTGWNGAIAVPYRGEGFGQKVVFPVAPFLKP